MTEFDHLLLLAADILDDLESSRIANENRLRSLREFELQSTPEYLALAQTVAGLKSLEHAAELSLKHIIRKHPLGGWVKRTVGVGEKQGARLLAAIGDPYWNTLHDRPRTVSELWAYCGYHVLPSTKVESVPNDRASMASLPAGQPLPDTQKVCASGHKSPADHEVHDDHVSVVGGNQTDNSGHLQIATHYVNAGVAPTRQRGQRANWSGTAKMRGFLVAESCIKNRRSPYRTVYDGGRLKYADAVHTVACRRCGPKGKPAPAGSPLSDGHKHARAMRLVAKAILRDLWIEAKHLNEQRPAA